MTPFEEKPLGSVWKHDGALYIIVTIERREDLPILADSAIFGDGNVKYFTTCSYNLEANHHRSFYQTSPIDREMIRVHPHEFTNELLRLETPPTPYFMEQLEKAR